MECVASRIIEENRSTSSEGRRTRSHDAGRHESDETKGANTVTLRRLFALFFTRLFTMAGFSLLSSDPVRMSERRSAHCFGRSPPFE